MNLVSLSVCELSAKVLGYFDKDVYFLSCDDERHVRHQCQAILRQRLL